MSEEKLSDQQRNQISERLQKLGSDIRLLKRELEIWQDFDKILWSREEFDHYLVSVKRDEQAAKLRELFTELVKHPFYQTTGMRVSSSNEDFENWFVERDRVLGEIAGKLKEEKERQKQQTENKTLVAEKIAELESELRVASEEKDSLVKSLQD